MSFIKNVVIIALIFGATAHAADARKLSVKCQKIASAVIDAMEVRSSQVSVAIYLTLGFSDQKINEIHNKAINSIVRDPQNSKDRQGAIDNVLKEAGCLK